ncbi:MAG TPA: putative porin [Candidatus Dormibacteraeota bacterium]|nr:putative porin [Candidatus Dormibacteraeota bacterium]
MNKEGKYYARTIATIAATLAVSATPVHGQSADGLIDKLVEKGILTVKEANELREESDKNFNQAYSVKSGMPEWVTALKFNGDFRGRFEESGSANDLYHTRDRFRYRMRFGVTASFVDSFDVGMRLASGNPQTNPGGTLVGGQPITANTDLNSLESRKFVWIDLAYAKWTPLAKGPWTVSATIGKMENPFQLSNMVWDYDINPEGGAFQVAYNLSDQHTLRGTSAFFVLDELNQGVGAVPSIDADKDPSVFGGQLILESKWSPKIESSIGVAAFNIVNRDSLSALVQPFYNSGNTRNPTTGQLVHNYEPIIGTGALTYNFDSAPLYNGVFPVKVYGEYMDNLGASENHTGWRAGVVIGKAGKKRTWQLDYRYQRLEADAWFDALVDDDNGGFYAPGNPQLHGTGKSSGWFGGTNVRGHLVQATYSFTDYLNMTFTYYLNELIIGAPGQKSDASHFMVDAMWRF